MKYQDRDRAGPGCWELPAAMARQRATLLDRAVARVPAGASLGLNSCLGAKAGLASAFGAAADIVIGVIRHCDLLGLGC